MATRRIYFLKNYHTYLLEYLFDGCEHRIEDECNGNVCRYVMSTSQKRKLKIEKVQFNSKSRMRNYPQTLKIMMFCNDSVLEK
nr:13592_t:CDS:2 [Entrophospora candida]